MESYLVYIGKAALAAGAFYIAFLLLFQNQKQFVFNRFYLPVSLAVSFIIPLITFTRIQYIEPTPAIDFSSFAYLSDTAEIPAEPAFVVEWYHYLFGIYMLGAAGFLFHLLLGHFKAISIIKKSWLKNLFEINVNITKKDVHPFSFFSKIVLSENTLSHPNLEMIISHENIHVKEKHTFDILFAELLFLFQWFNPFAWLIKDAMKNNLEYKTDQQITQKHNPQAYQLAMVGLAHKKGVAPFLNALNGSQLKNRIIMMKKKTENKYAFLKQLVVLPLLAILVMGLSNKEVITEIIPAKNQVEILSGEKVIKGKVTDQNGDPISGASIIIKGKTAGTISDTEGNYELKPDDENETLVFMMVGYELKEVPANGKVKIDAKLKADKNQKTDEIFYKVEEMPEFPGGEKALRKYIDNSVKYPEIAAENGIQGKVYVTFIIDKNGKVNDPQISRGVDPVLDKEALRVVNTLPRWKPGKQRGKTVNVSYTVPVDFVMTDELYRKYSKSGLDDNPLKEETKKSEEQSKLKETTVIGYGTQIKPTFVDAHIKAANTVFLRNKISGENPLYILNDVEIENIEDVNVEDIESISVLKDDSATAVYGGKGKNGVVIITTKKPVKISGNPIVLVDGQRYDSVEDANVDPDEIASISVLKNETASTKIYGEEAKNGVILIQTKTKFNTAEEKPLIVTDGIITGYKSMDDIDPETIESINVLKDKSAIEKYGNKGKNGVIEITMKPQKITTDLVLRKFIAKNIKYPVLAQEANREETVSLAVKFDKNGKIKQISENDSKLNSYKKADFILDEVVVVGYKTVKKGADSSSQETIETAKEKLDNLLVNEAKRVIQKIPEIDIEEFKGKTVGFTVKFMLQD